MNLKCFILIAVLDIVVAVVVLSIWSSKPAVFCDQVQGHNCDDGLWTGHVNCSQFSAASSCS